MNSDNVEEILNGLYYRGYDQTGTRLDDIRRAKADLDKYYAQKHAAEVLELIGPDEPEYYKGGQLVNCNGLIASLRKAVKKHFNA